MCPHRPGKYHPDFDAIFAGLLDRDPAGTLVLLAGKHERPREILEQRLQRTLGAKLRERMVLLSPLSGKDFARLVSSATAVLDSPAYAGGLTAYDAFAHHVPVVTQEGPLAVQRYTAALYRRMELPDLISTTPQEYVDTAVRLGTDESYRRAVTERLRDRSPVLFEDQTAVTAHEQYFESVVKQHADFPETRQPTTNSQPAAEQPQ